MLENPGVISSTVNPKTGKANFPNIPDAQLAYLEAALTRVKNEKFAGAVILAVHHPPYTFGRHITSLVMLKEIDAICDKVGVWPHAVLWATRTTTSDTHARWARGRFRMSCAAMAVIRRCRRFQWTPLSARPSPCQASRNRSATTG